MLVLNFFYERLCKGDVCYILVCGLKMWIFLNCFVDIKNWLKIVVRR